MLHNAVQCCRYNCCTNWYVEICTLIHNAKQARRRGLCSGTIFAMVVYVGVYVVVCRNMYTHT
jgi:hypothetical protein